MRGKCPQCREHLPRGVGSGECGAFDEWVSVLCTRLLGLDWSPDYPILSLGSWTDFTADK
jgi:hypothetical protein